MYLPADAPGRLFRKFTELSAAGRRIAGRPAARPRRRAASFWELRGPFERGAAETRHRETQRRHTGT